MLDLILSVARQREEIRAVFLNGSRANPAAPQDIFQDYDVVYFVTDMESFLADPCWINVFGELLIMQLPDDSLLFPSERRTRYAYLMQFADGNRIDLTLAPISELPAFPKEDSQTLLLLDKDNAVAPLPAPSDRDYWVKPPTKKEYLDCCNEFYWVSTYVGKGLWRKELPYALEILNVNMRPMLVLMLGWAIGAEKGFTLSIGKCGKYLKRYLDENIWQAYCATYPAGNDSAAWEAFFQMHRLFSRIARKVGDRLALPFPAEWEENTLRWAQMIQSLPHDATSFPLPSK